MTAGSTEFELKLEVPAERARAVGAQLSRLHVKTQRLRAIYFDTPQRLLGREGLVLRLRLEDGGWVQTLKGDSGHSLERLEHEVRLGRSRQAPRPEAMRHVDSPAGERLLHVLGRGFDDSQWEPLFETDVQRTQALVDEGASRIEIAFDRGRIASGARELALCEIEFELKEGQPRAAVELARRWCAAHGLWLSTISKAQKGSRLASAQGTIGAAATAVAPRLPKHASLRRIAGEALAASLDQVIRNASELAAGSGDDEHVHQMRVGIRRVRTALRELARTDVAQAQQPLMRAFRELGRHRDLMQVLGNIAPKLEQAGAPMSQEAPSARAPSPMKIVRAPAFQEALLELIALACTLRADDEAGGHSARREIRSRLAKLRKKALADGQVFERLDPQRQHRVRKRLKRLRYLAEFTAPLHPERALHAFLSRLKKAQDALGEYNDAITALAHYRERADTRSGAHCEPGAWFAVGWLQAERARMARQCGKLLRTFAKSHPFWS